MLTLSLSNFRVYPRMLVQYHGLSLSKLRVVKKIRNNHTCWNKSYSTVSEGVYPPTCVPTSVTSFNRQIMPDNVRLTTTRQ